MFLKVKPDLIFETSMPNTSKYQISVKSLKEFGSYKHLKFGLKHWLKYRLWCHTYVIAVMSQTFCYHCIEYIKFDTCANFHYHWNNNRKVIMGALMPPPLSVTDDQKSTSFRVKKTWCVLLRFTQGKHTRSIACFFE